MADWEVVVRLKMDGPVFCQPPTPEEAGRVAAMVLEHEGFQVLGLDVFAPGRIKGVVFLFAESGG